MECIMLEGYLDMISFCNLSMKISEEFDLFNTSLEVVCIKKSLNHMQHIVVFDFRVRYQEFVDFLDRYILQGGLSTYHLVVVELSLVKYHSDSCRQVNNLFSQIDSVSLLNIDLFDDFLRHLDCRLFFRRGQLLLMLFFLIYGLFRINCPERQPTINGFF